jgi:hypothetical protein
LHVLVIVCPSAKAAACAADAHSVLNDTDRFVTVPRVYAVCPPPPDLAPYVRLFWAAGAGPDEGSVERVVADGCCELIVPA